MAFSPSAPRLHFDALLLILILYYARPPAISLISFATQSCLSLFHCAGRPGQNFISLSISLAMRWPWYFHIWNFWKLHTKIHAQPPHCQRLPPPLLSCLAGLPLKFHYTRCRLKKVFNKVIKYFWFLGFTIYTRFDEIDIDGEEGRLF